MNKLLSARFLLTLMLGVTTCYMGATGKLASEAFAAIAGTVVAHYFNKARPNEADKKNPTV